MTIKTLKRQAQLVCDTLDSLCSLRALAAFAGPQLRLCRPCLSKKTYLMKTDTLNAFFTKTTTMLTFYKDNDTFEFTRHVSVVQRPSSVESRINLKLHLNL